MDKGLKEIAEAAITFVAEVAIAKLDAKNAEIERLKIELENERDGHAFEVSPAMYEAKIEQLHLVLHGVIDGVDKWAGDEDGVPHHMFESYKAAKNVLSLYTPNPTVDPRPTGKGEKQ